MSQKFKFSQVIDRPVEKVFNFIARDHVRNHPRWDPDIKLEQVSDGPIGVGTVIRRQNTRFGEPVEGKMEIVEFEPNRVMTAIIKDGPVVMKGRITFEKVSEQQTAMTTHVEFIELPQPVDEDFMMSRLERSGQNQKRLVESDL